MFKDIVFIREVLSKPLKVYFITIFSNSASIFLNPRRVSNSKVLLSDDYGTKLKTITPVTFTRCPPDVIGLNFAERAACSEVSFNKGCPLTALALTTLPFSSIKTRTLTRPPTPAAFAAAGYLGW